METKRALLTARWAALVLAYFGLLTLAYYEKSSAASYMCNCKAFAILV